MLDIYIAITVIGVVIILYLLAYHIYIATCLRSSNTTSHYVSV